MGYSRDAQKGDDSRRRKSPDHQAKAEVYAKSLTDQEEELGGDVSREWITIEEVLLFPSLIFDNKEESTRGDSGFRDGFIEVSAAHIYTWEEFTEENVNHIFGDFLGKKHYEFESKYLELERMKKVSTHVIKLECHLNSMFNEAMARLLRMTLGGPGVEFQKRVNQGQPRGVDIMQEGQTIEIAGNKGLKRPDWPVHFTAGLRSKASGRNLPEPVDETELAAVLVTTKNKEGCGIVVNGEAKRRYAFDPAWLAKPKQRQKARSTLGQMMMYCFHSKTRYGYVFNSEGVTVLRFFALGKTKEEGYGVHYAALPWRKTEGTMSAWKGLWALIMLSLHDKHRPIVTQDETCDLNAWSRFEEDGGRVLWVNHLTKIVVENGDRASGFRVVEASRDDFAAQLDEYLKGKPEDLSSKRYIPAGVQPSTGKVVKARHEKKDKEVVSANVTEIREPLERTCSRRHSI